MSDEHRSSECAHEGGRRRLVAGRVFDGDKILSPGWISIHDGRVEHLSEGVPDDCGVDELQPDLLLTPGFVDTHAHGAAGSSFGDRRNEALAALLMHRRHGTTTLFASLVSAPTFTLAAQMRALAPLVHQQLLAGVHLEGPWLSPDFRGAHRLDSLAAPSTAELQEFIDAADGTLRMVTIAPELPDALSTIEALATAGIAPAIGHTACTYETAKRAMDCGARIATHLFNAMPIPHHRNPGPVLALLEADNASLEVIADGIHLHDATLGWLLTHVPDRVVLVSDAMAAAGLGDGTYDLGGQRVDVSGSHAYLAETTTLAGSALTLHGMVRHAVQSAGADLAQVLRSATSIPARAHHLEGVGYLTRGTLANIVCMNRELDVVEVIYRGHTVAPTQRGSRASEKAAAQDRSVPGTRSQPWT